MAGGLSAHAPIAGPPAPTRARARSGNGRGRAIRGSHAGSIDPYIFFPRGPDNNNNKKGMGGERGRRCRSPTFDPPKKVPPTWETEQQQQKGDGWGKGAPVPSSRSVAFGQTATWRPARKMRYPEGKLDGCDLPASCRLFRVSFSLICKTQNGEPAPRSPQCNTIVPSQGWWRRRRRWRESRVPAGCTRSRCMLSTMR